MSSGLTVAITGPTGTFGSALLPMLEADERIDRVIGIARRGFDPSVHGWSKMIYRTGDVRDPHALQQAFQGADVVVHLAFLITGTTSPSTIRNVNVDGTLNAFRAAAADGARRFVHASSAAAYGFHPDNPIGMDEDWPRRPDTRFFYAQEKAEIEVLLGDEADAHAGIDLYVLRPPIVLGPHAVGAKSVGPGFIRPLLRAASAVVRASPVPLPLFVPAVPMQFVHEDDVAAALLACIVGAGPAGAYNIAGDGVVTARDLAHEVGLAPLPFPLRVTQLAARTIASMPLPPCAPPVTEWTEALAHPVIVDTRKARDQLGWRPRYSGLDAFRATVRPTEDGCP